MRFLAAEEIRRCETCAASTPHSRRRLAPRRLLALVVGALALFALRLPMGGLLLALVGLPLVLALLASDRAGGWHLACERCRGRWLAARASSRRAGWRGLRDTALS